MPSVIVRSVRPCAFGIELNDVKIWKSMMKHKNEYRNTPTTKRKSVAQIKIKVAASERLSHFPTPKTFDKKRLAFRMLYCNVII